MDRIDPGVPPKKNGARFGAVKEGILQKNDIPF
jgi:hypothetical protein